MESSYIYSNRGANSVISRPLSIGFLWGRLALVSTGIAMIAVIALFDSEVKASTALIWALAAGLVASYSFRRFWVLVIRGDTSNAKTEEAISSAAPDGAVPNQAALTFNAAHH